MNTSIVRAIEQSLVLSFSYDGDVRWVEPHTYGVQRNGKEALCAWQLIGGSGEGFRLYLMERAQGYTFGEQFNGSRPAYRRGDSRFVSVYAEL